MFDSSYAGLDETTQLVFRRLSLLPGACFTAETTAAVSGVPVRTAATALTRLTEAHLVMHLVPGRYAFHDLVGEYAALRHGPSSPDDLDGLYAHYIDRCLAAAETAYPDLARLPGPKATTEFADAAQALDWLTAELRNMVTVVRRAGTHPAAWRIPDALRGFLSHRRNLADWQTMATTARAAAEVAGDQVAVVSALLSLGQLHYSTRDYPGAIRHWTTALAHSHGCDWALGEAAIRDCLGTANADLDRLAMPSDNSRPYSSYTGRPDTGPPAD
jgi:hypothetical protein